MTDFSWTHYQNNPDDILRLSKIFSTDAAIYIKSPENFSGFNATARAILDELKKWHTRIRKHNSTEFHPSLLLSLEQLFDSLKKYPSLNEETCSYSAIIESLVFLAGYSKKSLDRYIYIYPCIVESGNQVFPKIFLIAPQVESRTPTAPYREACFQASAPYLEKFLLEKLDRDKVSQNFYPIIKNQETGEEKYSPFVMSLEFELHEFLRRGFFDNLYIPMIDFISDSIHYGKSEGLILEITSDYHIVKDELKVFNKELFVQSEILLHLKHQISALFLFCEKNLSKYITDTVPILQKKWEKLNDIYGKEKEFYNSDELINGLSEVISDFPYDEYPTETLKKFKEDSEFAVLVLANLKKEWGYFKNLRVELAIVNTIQKLFREIETFIGSKLVLYELDIEAKLKESDYIPLEEKGRLREKILEGIHSKFLFHVEKVSDTIGKYFISSKDVIQKSVENLQELSKIDIHYQKQLQVALSLFNESEFFENKKPVPEKKATVKKVSAFQPEYVHGAIGAFTLMLFFLLLYLLFGNSIYIALGGIISLIFGVVLSIVSPVLLKKTKISPKNISEEVESPIPFTGKKASINAEDSISKAFEKIVFGKSTSIEERIFDKESFSNQVKDNFKELVKEVPEYSKGAQNEKIFSKMEDSILSHSMSVIRIPSELVLGKKSDKILLYKQDLRSVAKRKELAEYFRNKAERFGYDKEMVRYYNFIIHAIEIGFAKYL
ncbi:MAG: hypothetical protein L6Q54_05520 [Leptospiraceae bacterium]|nr:hypothetical protein [Leptospiraceae bacterium]MCK6380697.1 hypothetical protein [Leptospiraceae bacterium]NUM42041.1 hypothetical protein [Leptospiraceae bacterium]